MLRKVLIGFGILAIIGALIVSGFVLLNLRQNALRARDGINDSGPMVDPERTSIAEQMGISREELDERLAAGEHITEIATSLGISESELKEIHARAREEAIQQLLEDGTLSEEQAEKIRQQSGSK